MSPLFTVQYYACCISQQSIHILGPPSLQTTKTTNKSCRLSRLLLRSNKKGFSAIRELAWLRNNKRLQRHRFLLPYQAGKNRINNYQTRENKRSHLTSSLVFSYLLFGFISSPPTSILLLTIRRHQSSKDRLGR